MAKAPTLVRPARRASGQSATPVPRDPAPVIPLRPPSLTDQAYLQIEELIVTLQIPPGSAVSEALLSERLGIGRTPIREAMQRLVREHLVVALPQRGYLVSQIDVRMQLRLLETRREVERLVARSAARRATIEEQQRFAELAETFERAARKNDATAFMRADHEFNELSLQAARNEFAASAMRMMNGLSRRFWYMHWQQAADLPESARAHGALAHAISLRDEDAAAKALDALLDGILAFTKATLSTDF